MATRLQAKFCEMSFIEFIPKICLNDSEDTARTS